MDYGKEYFKFTNKVKEINIFNFICKYTKLKRMILNLYYEEDIIDIEYKLDKIKEIYNNLDLIYKDFKIPDVCFNPYVFYYSDIYEIHILEEDYFNLEKYLLMKELENKLPIKNIKTKNKKI